MTTNVHVGDEQGKATNPIKAAMPLSIATEANLKLRANDVNDFNISGKKEGCVLVTENFEIVVAQGQADNDPWGNVCDATNDLNPTGNAKTHNGTIGDIRRKAEQTPITSLSIPVVTQEDLEQAVSSLNTAYLSGKKLGSVVTYDNNLYVAAGSLPTSKWVCTAGASEDKTPTGASRADLTSAVVGDSNRKTYTADTITCVDFPTVAGTEITTAASSLNTDPQAGVVAGAVVIGVTTSIPTIFVSKGDGTWLNQTTNTVVTPA